MKCRCGHGQQWHRRPARVSGWQRERGEKPKWLPCQYRDWSPKPDHRPEGIPCKCRDWHPVEP